jgi:hypothetical protein
VLGAVNGIDVLGFVRGRRRMNRRILAGVLSLLMGVPVGLLAAVAFTGLQAR